MKPESKPKLTKEEKQEKIIDLLEKILDRLESMASSLKSLDWEVEKIRENN